MVPSLEGDEKLRRDKMLDWLDEVKWKPIVSPRAGGGLDLMLKNHCCTQTRKVFFERSSLDGTLKSSETALPFEQASKWPL